MRTMTLKDYVLSQFNQMIAAEGVRVVAEGDRPRPVLATTDGNVVQLSQKQKETS
jgi:hypothetical protein